MAFLACEYAAQPVLGEKRQPCEAVELIRAQPGVQPGRRLGAAERACQEQAVDLTAPRGGLTADHAEFGQFFP